MSEKGDQTRAMIREEARKLFAERGFHRVTMKDICEASGLSRGGLYRHYDSTAAIFEALFLELSANSGDMLEEQIAEGLSAQKILKDALALLKQEMMTPEDSLSLAIYEYAGSVDSTLFEHLEKESRKYWTNLIEYGIKTGEFQNVVSSEVVTMITYAYQGIRMWSRVVHLTEQAAEDYENSILRMVM